MKRPLKLAFVLLSAFAVLFVFSSCDMGVPSQSSSDSSSSASDLPAYAYTYDPYALPEAVSAALGNSLPAYKQAVDAIRAGKDSFPTADETESERIRGILEANYVPYGLMKSYAYDAASGQVKLGYRFTKNDVVKDVSDYEGLCGSIMRLTLRQGDSDTAKAMALYFYVTGALYEAPKTSLYNAFTSGASSYNNYAQVLSVLFLQAGLDCETVQVRYGAEDYLVAAAKLDGAYYYFDPYIECSRTNGKGLVEFGMTTAECKGYLSGSFTVASGIKDGGTAPESADARYAPLRACAAWSFSETRTAIQVTEESATGTFELPRGK